jgi:hypothetical protein
MPDGLRPDDGRGFLMIEGGGSLDHITVASDSAAIDTIRDGFLHPTGVTLDGNTARVTEGQLSSLAYPTSGSPPRLPSASMRFHSNNADDLLGVPSVCHKPRAGRQSNR